MLEITKKFEGGTSPREVAEYARSTDEEKEVLNVIEVLKDAKILINNPQEDDKALDYFKGMMGNPYPHLAYFLLTDRCRWIYRESYVRGNRYQRIGFLLPSNCRGSRSVQ
jgi:hypothetical protein